MIRNLLFYCYPIRGSIWPWHIARLLDHKEAWNGRKILVVALDDRTEKESLVRDCFSPLGAEVVIRKNDSKNGEQAHFVETLGLLESRREDEATFYAHAKGVTRKGAVLENVLRWSDLMYRANLSFLPLVDRKLSKFQTAGCLRWTNDGHRKNWCYAGTFFWMRHSAIFSRNWKEINQGIYGVEDYPGRHFKPDEAYFLTKGSVSPPNLYGGHINEKFIYESMKTLEKEEKECTKASWSSSAGT